MKNLVVVCSIALLLLSISVIERHEATKPPFALTCNLNIQPGLQVYCIKRIRKENLKDTGAANIFRIAIDNSLHFIARGVLDKYFNY